MSEPIFFIFLLDNSGSMDEKIDLAPSGGGVLGGLGSMLPSTPKVDVLNAAFYGFMVFEGLKSLDSQSQVGVVRYGTNPVVVAPPQPLSQFERYVSPQLFEADLGSTNTVAAFEQAQRWFDDAGGSAAHNTWVIHITDGWWNTNGNPKDVALSLMGAGCHIYNVLIDKDASMIMARDQFHGYSNPADVQLPLAQRLIEISSVIPAGWLGSVRSVFPNFGSGNKLFFPAGTADQLKGFFEMLEKVAASMV